MFSGFTFAIYIWSFKILDIGGAMGVEESSGLVEAALVAHLQRTSECAQRRSNAARPGQELLR